MTTTNPVPSADVSDLLFNAQKLDEIVNSDLQEYTDRLGVLRQTAAGAMARFAALNPRGAWVTATLYHPRDLVLDSGTWYIALDTHTSGATFAGDLTAHWRPEQGVTRANLADLTGASNGAGIPKHNSTLNYVAGTIGAKLYEANVCDYPWLAKGDGTTDDWAAIEAANLWLKNKGGGRLIFPNRCPATGSAAVFIVGYRISIYSHVHYFGERGVTIKASASSVDNIIGEGNNLMDASVASRQVIGGAVTRLGKPDFLTNYTEVEAYINGGYNGYAKTDVEITGIIFDGNQAARLENQLNLVGAATGTFLSGENVTSSTGGAARAAYVYGTASISLEPRTITGSFDVGAVVTGVDSGATMTIGSKQADDAFQNNIRLMNVSHAVVSGCHIKNSVFTALSVYDVCANVTIEKNFFYDNNKPGTTYTAGWNNIYVEYYTNDITIDRNIIIGGLGYSILCAAVNGVHRDTKITRNKIYNPASDGIRIAQDSGTASQFSSQIVENTIMDAAGVGSCAIRLVHNGSSGGISEALVTGNTIRGCVNGILFQGRISNSEAYGNSIRTCSGTPLDTQGGVTLTGNISHNNRTDSGTMVESAITFVARTDVKAGTDRHRGTTGTSVSTTDVTLYTVANANNKTLLSISGDTGSEGFVDLVHYAYGALVVISSGTAYGAPAARTYTRTGSLIQLRMAAGTYSCNVSAVENQL
jgi:hypothetical protein